MAERKRSDPKRRGPASRPGASGRGRARPARIAPRDSRPSGDRPTGLRGRAESVGRSITEPIRQALHASAQQQSEQRLGLAARRAAILAAVVCVLTLTIAGPVRTYFAQRTEMRQLAASEAALREQIAELETQRAKLADPVYIAAQARERLGFVKPGDIPYQVQLPPGAVADAPAASPQPQLGRSTDPWYTALWHTIADTPHGPPEPPAADQPPPTPPPPPPGPPPPAPPGG